MTYHTRHQAELKDGANKWLFERDSKGETVLPWCVDGSGSMETVGKSPLQDCSIKTLICTYCIYTYCKPQTRNQDNSYCNMTERCYVNMSLIQKHWHVLWSRFPVKPSFWLIIRAEFSRWYGSELAPMDRAAGTSGKVQEVVAVRYMHILEQHLLPPRCFSRIYGGRASS